MHRRVIGSHYDKSAVGAGHGRIHKCIGADIHTYVLHAHYGAFAHIRHSEGFLHGGFLVSTPTGMNTTLRGYVVILNKFSDFGAWCAWIGVHSAESGMYSSKSDGFIAKQKMFFHYYVNKMYLCSFNR